MENKNNIKKVDIDKKEDLYMSKILNKGKIGNIFNKMDNFLEIEWMFIILIGILSGGVVLGTFMFLQYGSGMMNDIFIVQMLKKSINDDVWSTIIAFEMGFFVARLLEGPLVGIFDIGGGIMEGIGTAIPAIILSFSSSRWIMHNGFFSLLIGLGAGLITGVVIYLVKKYKPSENISLGTDIMMGAGNQSGIFLGPLVLVAAGMYNPIVGLGASLGGVLFFALKRTPIGGIVLGAMLFGIIPLYV